MSHGLIIDTDKYSGGFERQMCAYATGHIGDCGVGDREVEEYLLTYEKVKGVIQVPDEYGCHRPVEICETKGVLNNGMGFHFKEGEEEVALLKLQSSIKKYHEPLILIAEGHRGKNIPHWTGEDIDREIQRHSGTIERVMGLSKVYKYPAYQSVLIHFQDVPSEEAVDFIKQRAQEYAKCNNITVTGFRVQ